MIGRLSGIVIERRPPFILLDVQGVGYELEAPMSTFYNLPERGKPTVLLTHLVVREDAHLLYGFLSEKERSLFRLLLKVNGVGARVALSILSGMSVDEFLSAVAAKDVTAMTRVPGIGKKTAERLLFDLTDKAGGDLSALLPDATLPGGGVDDTYRQAEDALQALGYKAAEIKRMLDRAEPDGDGVEALIKAALRGARAEALSG